MLYHLGVNPLEICCAWKFIRRTVWLERMKVNLVIFNAQFIFWLINETDTTDFSIYALEAFLWKMEYEWKFRKRKWFLMLAQSDGGVRILWMFSAPSIRVNTFDTSFVDRLHTGNICTSIWLETLSLGINLIPEVITLWLLFLLFLGGWYIWYHPLVLISPSGHGDN